MFENLKMVESFEQNEDGSKVNKAQKGLSEFVVTSGDAPELLDFLPEALDEVTLFVHPPITFTLNFVRLAARNVRDCPDRFEPIDKGPEPSWFLCQR